jgi:hypothetical protein
MAQPKTPKSLQSRDQVAPIGESGIGIAPSTRDDAAGDKRGDNREQDAARAFTPPNVGRQGTDQHSDMYTQTMPDDDRGGVAGQDELEVARLNAPDQDDDLDPDAQINENGSVENEDEDEDEDILVRLLHDMGVHHINGHPLDTGTVISMKRKDFEHHQSRGMRAEEVGDDYDGEVYDVSDPWKPEQKDEHGNVINDEPEAV